MSTYSPLFSTRKTVPVTLSPMRNLNSYLESRLSNFSYSWLRPAGAAATAETALRERLAPSLAGRAAAPTAGRGAMRDAGAASSARWPRLATGRTVRS